MNNNAISLFFIVALGLFLVHCSGNKEKTSNTSATSSSSVYAGGQASVVDDASEMNIVQVAVSSPDHTTLVAAVQAAGLVDVLANNGPLTVFAPTNAAFEALPEGTVENLLKPENKATLAGIITYHAAPGTYTTKYFKDGMELYQATGANVLIEVKEGEYFVNGSKILASVEATNGVVHIIDGVLLPPDN